MNSESLPDLWVYLSSNPLLFLTLTLSVYLSASALFIKTKHNPLFNPIVLSVAVIVIVLMLTDTSYFEYFEGAKFIHFLLGPATVALAIPLYQQLETIKQALIPITVTLLVGCSVGTISTLLLAKWLGASDSLALSMAPKSVTTPVAMSISEYIGGIQSLTAALVVCTGMLGGLIGHTLCRIFRITDESAQGIALGITAHGIGTVRAFQMSAKAGAFASLGMALSAMITALLLPWFVQYTHGSV